MAIRNLRWVIISLIAIATVVNYIDRNALAVMWPSISAELGLDKNDYALVISFFMVGYAIGQSLFGKIFDMIGIRLGFVLAIVVWSISIMLHAAARSATGFGLARFWFRYRRSRQLAWSDKEQCRMVPHPRARSRSRHL